MAWVRLIVEILVTLGGSIAAFVAIGACYYALGGVLVALVTLAMALTARARNETSLVVEDDATPLPIRITVAICAPTLIGLFWPVLPLVIAFKRSAATVSARALEAREARLASIEDAQDRE